MTGLVALATAVSFGARLAPERLGYPLRAGDARRGEEIVVCGALFPVGTPVVLWFEPAGFDAYLPHRHDRPDIVLPSRPAPGCNTPERLSARPRRAGGITAGTAAGGTTPSLDELRPLITQFVVHYDASFTSRNCFHVLHDVRGLSVHFLLDLDGVIYQTCDVAEKARHARDANVRSIGVEIAHPGVLEEGGGIAGRYRRDGGGTFLDLPAWLGPRPVRTAGFLPRPARPEPVEGRIHGRLLTQYDFTEEQYRALGRLVGALSNIFPAIALEVPRDPSGRVLDRAIEDAAARAAFRGILGHYHLTVEKVDPGPAFDWERFLDEARRARRRTR